MSMCWARTRRWLMGAAAGAIAFPLILWLLLPTEAARQLIISRLSEATGHLVALEKVEVAGPGSVILRNFSLAAPGSEGPWLQAESARLDVGILELARGRLLPRALDLRGLMVSLRRAPDGSLEGFDSLPSPAESGPGQLSSGGASSDGCFANWRDTDFTIHIADGKFSYLDRKDGYSIELGSLDGKATWLGLQGRIEELTGEWNGGQVELVAQASVEGEPSFQGHARVQGVRLDDEAGRFVQYAIPLPLGDDPEGPVRSTLALNFFFAGKGRDQGAILGSLNGGGAVILDPVVLDGSGLLSELESIGGDFIRGNVGSIRSEFRLADRRVSTDALTIRVARQPIVLAGWTTFDGDVDYRINAVALAGGLGSDAQRLLDGLDLDLGPVGAIRLKGNLAGRLEWVLDGEDGRPLAEESARLRSMIDRLRSKLAGHSLDPAVRRMGHEGKDEAGDARGKGRR